MGHLSGALDRASEETMGTTSAPTMRLRSAFLLGKRIETLALEHSHGETPRFSSLMQSLNVIYRAESFPLVFFFWVCFGKMKQMLKFWLRESEGHALQMGGDEAADAYLLRTDIKVKASFKNTLIFSANVPLIFGNVELYI